LIPQDEAVVRDGALCCVQCLAAPVSRDDAAALSDEALAALVTEFIQLHAEAKQLNDRLEQIKEQLKRHAASQPRVANAVMLRTGEYAVKCGYSVRVSYHADKLAAVEAMLGTEPFTALFTRKITFSPAKKSLDAFLASDAADTACGARGHSGRGRTHRGRHSGTHHAQAQDGHVWHTPHPSSRQTTAMTPPTPPPIPERPLSATRLAQYATVRGRCERYLRLALFPSEGQALMHRYGVTPEALTPLLAEAGSVFEQAAVTQLAAEATVIDVRHQSTQACIDTIRR
jgi:hypothetical protein